MTKHAVYAPSGACKWMVCRGSTAMEKGMPNPTSKYSDEGTAAHYLAAELLKNPDMDFLGFVLCVYEDDVVRVQGVEWKESTIRSKWKVTEEFLGHVRTYVDHVYELCNDDTELYVEVSLPLKKITGEDAEGTSDTVLLDGDHLIVIDLKFGRGIGVNVEENEQLLIYALAAIDFFEPNHNHRLERITIWVDQPRADYFDFYDISRSDLETFREKAMYAAQMAQTVVAAHHDLLPEEMHHSKSVLEVLTPGDHCRKGFCRARGKCPALAEKVLDAIGAPTFQDLDAPPLDNITDMDLLAFKANAIPLIESWCKGVRGLVESSLYAGKRVPGWKVVQGKKGNRQWIDDDLAEKVMRKLKIKHDIIFDYKLRTPPAVERSYKANIVNEKQWEKLSGQITQAAGGSSVAVESDKREAISVTPPAFADLNSDPLKGLIN